MLFKKLARTSGWFTSPPHPLPARGEEESRRVSSPSPFTGRDLGRGKPEPSPHFIVKLHQYAPTITKRLMRIALAALVIGSMIPATAAAVRGEARIGGDQGRHTGIDTLAAFLNTRLRGEIVYDHWLGWELAYYLGDAPPVIVLYSPMPEALAADMREQTAARYLVAPSPALAAPWLDTLNQMGIHSTVIYEDTASTLLVYRLEK